MATESYLILFVVILLKAMSIAEEQNASTMTSNGQLPLQPEVGTGYSSYQYYNQPEYTSNPSENSAYPIENPLYPSTNPTYPPENPPYPPTNLPYPPENPSYPTINKPTHPAYPAYPAYPPRNPSYPSTNSPYPSENPLYPPTNPPYPPTNPPYPPYPPTNPPYPPTNPSTHPAYPAYPAYPPKNPSYPSTNPPQPPTSPPSHPAYPAYPPYPASFKRNLPPNSPFSYPFATINHPSSAFEIMADSMPEDSMACYANGPLTAAPVLPTPKLGETIAPGSISCAEVTGYIMALNRYYTRKCQRMAEKCPANYQYAVSWFGAVGNDMAAKCNAT